MSIASITYHNKNKEIAKAGFTATYEEYIKK
jgi:hypothetical protein